MRKVGTVSLIGRPNVGKSTFMNTVLQYKVAITTDTPQTTRDKIKGIYTDENTQIIFIDTPGIHKPKQKLGDSLNEQSFSAIKEVDLPIFLVPSNDKIGPGDKFIINLIKNKKLAIITKNDLDESFDNEKELLELGFEKVIKVSTEDAESIALAIKIISSFLPEDNLLYPEDEVTDKSMRFIAKELIRETAIDLTSDEVPHSIGVIVEEFIESKNELEPYEIHAVIYVERESQKGILIGKGAKMIKEIGQKTRLKLKNNFGHPVRLFLRVKVNKNWSKKPNEIIKMGY